MESKRRVFKEVWIGAGLAAITAFFLTETGKMPKAAAKYPRFILITLLALSVCLLLQGIWYSLKPEKSHAKDAKPMELDVLKFPMVVFALVAVYLVLFKVTNFFIATAVFVPIMMLLYGQRKVFNILLITVGLDSVYTSM